MAALGSSLVTDVLQKSGKLEKEDLKTCVRKLSQKAMEVKAQIYESIFKQYTEFIPSFDLAIELNSKVKDLSSEMNSLNGKIKGDVETQLKKANNIYTNLSQQLNETNSIINVLQKLCETHDALSELSVLIDCKEYYKASEKIILVRSHLKDFPKTDDESKVFKALRAEHRIHYTELVHTLQSLIWDKCISWKTATTPSWDNIDSHLKTEVQICTSDSTHIDLALPAMEYLGILEKKLKEFGQKFLQFVIRPIFIFPRLKPVQELKKQRYALSFKKDVARSEENIEATSVADVLRGLLFLPQGGGASHVKRLEWRLSFLMVSTLTAFDGMIEIFEGLNDTLMNKKVSKQSKTGNEPETTLASMLGECVWSTLSDIIIKDCLTKYVPKTSVQLEQYHKTVAATVKFEKFLIKRGYLKDGTDTLQTYSKNVTTHFSDKKCQDLLLTAREILKSDINFHNAVLMSMPEGHKARRITPLAGQSNGMKEQTIKAEEKPSSKMSDMSSEKKLSDTMFHFPTCRVSECMPKFFNLVYKTLIEAAESTNAGGVRLFYTVRNMIELYGLVVPTYYEDDLRDLPQMSALHYNNCMYLSHHLLTLGHEFRPKLPPPLNSGAATFVDMVSPLRKVGKKCFDNQLQKQRRSLLDIIDGGGGFSDPNILLMEKAFEQVCYQLLKLNKVWKDILPLNIFHSSLGTLLNVALKKVIDEILKLEDISSDHAHSLHHLMGVLVRKGPEVIQISSEEMSKNVDVWKKFVELRRVVDSSLQSIEDRWSAGKGPLAQEFDSNEIRRLIRALFQNTDRRANLLAKIRPTA